MQPMQVAADRVTGRGPMCACGFRVSVAGLHA